MSEEQKLMCAMIDYLLATVPEHVVIQSSAEAKELITRWARFRLTGLIV